MTNDDNKERRIVRGRYQLVKRLGSGGMGSVWLAVDTTLERKVALKELLEYGSAPDREERRIRALAEARALARVDHPAIVSILDVFIDNGDPWIVMDYINGHSLDSIIAKNPLDERTAATIGLKVLDALQAAHRAGVVHRDVKPLNILITDSQAVYLVDFGIAKIAGELGLTIQSRIVGTPDYIAPERLRGESLTPAADLWSLGVTLFHMLEGYSPFAGRKPRRSEVTFAAILHDPPPRLQRADKLTSVILRLLNKDPALRPDATEIAKVLSAVSEGRPLPPQWAPPPPSPRPLSNFPTTVPLASLRPPPVKLPAPDRKARPRITEASSSLLSMSQEQAAKTIASYPPAAAAQALELISTSEPETARAILQMISSRGAGRTVNHLSSRAAASILGSMPPRAVARILECTDPRQAGGVFMKLSAQKATSMLREMSDSLAVAVLRNVEPATVASLLSDLDDTKRNLLGQLPTEFRKQVLRHLVRN